MKRIIDANLNRAIEGLRVLEEISRFVLNDKKISEKLKSFRHKLAKIQDDNYTKLLNSRDSQNDIGFNIENPSSRTDLEDIFKANIKRFEQSMRVLAEYDFKNLKIYEKLRFEAYELEKFMWNSLETNFNKFKLQDKKLYLVTSSEQFKNDDEFLDAIASALEGGVQIVQLREKNANAKRILTLGKKIRQLTLIYNKIFIINDRIDLAMALNADGVHLGQNDIDLKTARKIVGNNFIIGISTHAPTQAKKAEKDGADYIGVGPIFATPTKPQTASVGLSYAKWASENVKIPFFTIGGIDLNNCDEVKKQGVKRIAVVRAIMNSQNPKISAQKFLKKLK